MSHLIDQSVVILSGCWFSHIGHVVNLYSIVDHVRFEADLSVEERSQLDNFGKIGYTGLQSKIALCRLFSSRIYDSNMIYRVVKKTRDLHYCNATDCMLKLVELVNSHSSKVSLFEMASYRGGRLEILHWLGSFFSLFVENHNDFILIDGTHKTNIYNLSLVVTTVVDSLGIPVPVGFMVAPSENSSSIESHLDHLKIGSNPSHDLYGSTSCAIMTDKRSLVKVVSSILGYNYCLCSFHVNQLAFRVSSLSFHVGTLFSCGYTLCYLYT